MIARISDVPIRARTVWNAQTCDVALLPWLAWALGVDEWDSEWTESTKRAVIASSAAVHRTKGTLKSIRLALSSAGYPGAVILEGESSNNYDGAITHNGVATYGEPDDRNWAYYRVRLERPISNTQADQVKRILANTAPARCVLIALEFDRVAATYNAAIDYAGKFNYGIVS